MALCATGAVQEGLTQLSHAVSLDPANIAVRLQLATTLARLKRHEEAIAQFLRIVQLDPRNTDALTGLAANYAQTNQMDKAVEYLEAAFQIARSTGNRRLAEQIGRQIERYRQSQPVNPGDR
jgi:cytochrome c-type biogenesis protein CcmH/NrfG